MEFLKRIAFVSGALFACVAACKPDLDQRATRITGPRVLAVRADPAEVEPRDAIAFSTLVVDEHGVALTAPAASWSFCASRKPLAELGPVSPACYGQAPGSLLPLGVGARVEGAMPSAACKDFGPEVPQAKPGEPFGRPVDPDPTGGYYQPVTLQVDDDIAVAQARIACGVAGAPSEDVVTFRQRYHANENPTIVTVRVAGNVAAPDAPVAVERGAHVDLTIEWPACPAPDVCGDGICGPDETRQDCAQDCGKPRGCQGAERYLWFDPDARTLVVRREEMRVSWFSAGGLFERDRTGRAEDDPAPSSQNTWVAPDTSGPVHAWVVLRDSRGGVAWREIVFDVR